MTTLTRDTVAKWDPDTGEWVPIMGTHEWLKWLHEKETGK